MYTHELHKSPKLPALLKVYSEKQKVAEEIKALKASDGRVSIDIIRKIIVNTSPFANCYCTTITILWKPQFLTNSMPVLKLGYQLFVFGSQRDE